MSCRAFERLIQKETKNYLYVIRNTTTVKIFKFFKTLEELTSIQQTIEHSELNKALSLDLLKTFRSDLSNELSLERSQNHSIETDDARFVNKSSYDLFKKQLNEQTTQVDYLMKRDLIRSSTSS